MALDILIPGESRPLATVPISIEDHDWLMAEAEVMGLEQTRRLREYYEDVEFAPGEVGQLLSELNALSARSPSRMMPLMEQLATLLVLALKERRPVRAVAD